MSKNIVILQGHPDNSKRHLCHALASAYQEGAEQAGHHTILFDVAVLDFPVLRSREDWEQGETPAAVLEVQKSLLEADHLVIFYPLWLGTMPALFKALLEQVFRPEPNKISGDTPAPWRKLMKGCTARIVVTMGMPAFFYRWFYRAHGLKLLKRNILSFSGIGPIGDSLIGMVDKLDKVKAEKWFKKMRTFGEAAK